jgi:hypothetical protein
LIAWIKLQNKIVSCKRTRQDLNLGDNHLSRELQA